METNGVLLAYLDYVDRLDRYWAPTININYIEVDKKYRGTGLGSLLLEELLTIYSNETITLEIFDGGETNTDILRHLYGKYNFIEIEDAGGSYVLARFPKGKTIEDIKAVPKDILFAALKNNNTYSLPEIWLEEIVRDDYGDEYLEDKELFKEAYKDLKDSLVVSLLNYF